jgi:hypothetical protein
MCTVDGSMDMMVFILTGDIIAHVVAIEYVCQTFLRRIRIEQSEPL